MYICLKKSGEDDRIISDAAAVVVDPYGLRICYDDKREDDYVTFLEQNVVTIMSKD